MNSNEIKVGSEVKFKRDGLICGSAIFSGVILKIDDFIEIKYIGENQGYANICYDDILEIIN